MDLFFFQNLFLFSSLCFSSTLSYWSLRLLQTSPIELNWKLNKTHNLWDEEKLLVYCIHMRQVRDRARNIQYSGFREYFQLLSISVYIDVSSEILSFFHYYPGLTFLSNQIFLMSRPSMKFYGTFPRLIDLDIIKRKVWLILN